jgi:hypothetical protein
MTEEFLHYVWKFSLISHETKTETGEMLSVLHPGTHNHDGGPDFINARVRIGNTTWAGNVEIHVNASDWFRHHHDNDRAYDNVILHVVNDLDLTPDDRKKIRCPTLVIRDRYPAYLYERYQDFQQNHSWIPCQNLMKDLPSFHFLQWSASLVLERLGQKAAQLEQFMESGGNDWEEAFYKNLCRAFGARINALPFELLAKSLPLKIILRHRVNLFQTEALLFGQASLLEPGCSEEYPLHLRKEYDYLKAKYSLAPITPGLWKFLRLRPSNFPTIRIAQLAMLLHTRDDLFSRTAQFPDLDCLKTLFFVRASSYWDTHFVFGKLSPGRPKVTGAAFTELVIMNHILPFLFYYGKEKEIESFRERSLTILEFMPGEINSDTVKWKELGMPVSSAFYTQALIQMKTHYCDRKRCLECRIGRKLMDNEE